MTDDSFEKTDNPLLEIAGYDYQLPESAIAQHPAEPRDSSRLLVLDRRRDELEHRRFTDLTSLLKEGDLLILNDTRVIPARLFGKKIPGGGQAEVFLIRDLGGDVWEAMIKVTGRLRSGLQIDLGAGFSSELIQAAENPLWQIQMRGPEPIAKLLDEAGHIPLPPYIKRDDNPADRERYQTVFAKVPGAVAAPTAGLHFTPQLLDALSAMGVGRASVTLHVGPGTFRPLEADDLISGRLHEEHYHLPQEAIAAIEETKARGGRVVAVGTTTTRVLEACSDERGVLSPGTGATRLFIREPYRYRVVDAQITNFHLPRSSLLMLVAAFAGRERILAAYGEAIRLGYRFYSYGDGMLIC